MERLRSIKIDCSYSYMKFQSNFIEETSTTTILILIKLFEKNYMFCFCFFYCNFNFWVKILTQLLNVFS